MIILDYNKKKHKEIVHAAVLALKQGKVVAYPTDTSYGLAADAENHEAIEKLYKIKQRQSSKPVHVVVPSVAYVKKIAHFDKRAQELAGKFWPGALTLVLWLKSKKEGLKKLSAGTGTIGVRMPKHPIALELAAKLGRPVTTTSANPSAVTGGYDSYTVQDIVDQFSKKRNKPDIIINAGSLPKRMPSTVVRVLHEPIEILRQGPITETQIKKVLDVRY